MYELRGHLAILGGTHAQIFPKKAKCKSKRRLPVLGSISALARPPHNLTTEPITTYYSCSILLELMTVIERRKWHCLGIDVWNPKTLSRDGSCIQDPKLNIHKIPEAFNGSVSKKKETSYLSYSETWNQNIIIFIRPTSSMRSQSVVYKKDVRRDERYAPRTTLNVDIV